MQKDQSNEFFKVTSERVPPGYPGDDLFVELFDDEDRPCGGTYLTPSELAEWQFMRKSIQDK